MESDNIVYWTLYSKGHNSIQNLYYTTRGEDRVRTLEKMLGCSFLTPGTIDKIRDRGVMDPIQWYGTIVDRNKHLLAKIKYGI